MKRLYFQLISDAVIALIVFFVSLFIHPGDIPYELKTFGAPALLFYGFHILVSLVNRKYEHTKRYSNFEFARLYSRCWLYTSGLALLILVTFQIEWISRQILLTNIFGLFISEFTFIFFLTLLRKSVLVRDYSEIDEAGFVDIKSLYPSQTSDESAKVYNQGLKLWGRVGDEARNFLLKFFNPETNHTLILNSYTKSVILEQPSDYYRNILNFQRLNNIRYINQFFEAANSRLLPDGLIIVCAETKNQRKARILKKYPAVLNSFYYVGDYVVMRILPKLPYLKKIYFALTKGKKRVISRPEILGRLCSCGFEIVEEQIINKLFYVVARKKKLPAFNNDATYGPLIYLNRIGKNGKMIKVYKLRTMHPFSEYLQDYVYEKNNLAKGGKLKDDFRVTTLGKIMRKLWLDELPMIWNFLRGDLKLVGVRPLSKHYFNLYSPDLQQKRIKFKPGLIPPFYADMPGTIEEIMESEMRYLEAHEKHPLRTDWKYFWKAFNNIFIKRFRSG